MPIIMCKTKKYKKCRHLRWGLEKSPDEDSETVRIEEWEPTQGNQDFRFLKSAPRWFLAKQSSSSQHVPDPRKSRLQFIAWTPKYPTKAPTVQGSPLAVCSVNETVSKGPKITGWPFKKPETIHLFLAAFSAPPPSSSFNTSSPLQVFTEVSSWPTVATPFTRMTANSSSEHCPR